MQLSENKDRRTFLKYALSIGAGGAALALLTPQARLGERILRLLNASGEKPLHETIVSMGTFVRIDIYDTDGKDCAAIFKQAFSEFTDVDRLMSVFQASSDVSAINSRAGNDMASVDPRVIDVLAAAVDMGDGSGGMFDVTVLPVLKAYGFRGEHPGTPDLRMIESAAALVDYRRIEYDRTNNTAGLKKRGAQMDLGGIAKGYAVDRAADALRNCGVQRAIINAGGDIYAIGAQRNGDAWQIGIQHPRNPEKICGRIRLSDGAVATSGNYENFIEYNGEKIGHLIHPHAGQAYIPALSATVAAPTAMEADALSTAAFLFGMEHGKSFIERRRNAECAFVSSPDGVTLDIHSTAGFPL